MPDQDILLSYLQHWSMETKLLRSMMLKDYRYVEGDQIDPLDKAKLQREFRPLLAFNELLPQIELVAGLQRGAKIDLVATPRNTEDKRLAEIASATLKAANEYSRYQRAIDRMSDDGFITGMGILEVLYSLDNAKDVIWGDIFVKRISPLAFIFDPHAVEDNLQDGEFMGKFDWLSVQEFKERFPKAPVIPTRTGLVPHTIFEQTQHHFADSMFDAITNKIRLITLYYKHFRTLSFLVNERTGVIFDGGTESQVEQTMKRLLNEDAEKAFGGVSIALDPQTNTFNILNREGILALSSIDTPLEFTSREQAEQFLKKQRQQLKSLGKREFTIFKRRVPDIRVATMYGWGILEDKRLDYQDRQFPFVVYISRRYSDNLASIQGLIRQNIDAQDEINKRYSNYLAHLNSSAHSGWLNRQPGGADPKLLEQMGSKPGVVVNYTSIPPQRIEPTQLSPGHFNLLPLHIQGIQRRTGVNAELLGITTQTTVSGRAIASRQQGGLTMQTPRFRSLEEAQLDFGIMLLSRIQQFYPVEKIMRIIGTIDTQLPLGANGRPIFQDPITGQPMPESLIVELLTRMKNMQFDLTLAVKPFSESERQVQFERGVQLVGLITSTGRDIGPQTMDQLIDLSDMPAGLSSALKQDLQQAANPAFIQPGGLNSQVQSFIGNLRGGRAGGTRA